MPELPDLTVFSENLSKQYVGKKIGDVSVLRTKPVLPMPTNQFTALLQEKFFQRIERRGKQLVFVIDDMNELWVHLMLHGEIYALQPHESVPAASCVVIGFQDKTRLAFADGTQWMKIKIRQPGQDPPAWASKGMDPLSKGFTVEYLTRCAATQRLGALKPFLMNQKLIGGIGNAFADEILWDAHLAPTRLAAKLIPEELPRLHMSIRNVLSNAVQEVRKRSHGGFTGEIRDFLSVHVGKGKPCPRCTTPVHFALVKGRGTYWCPRCQV
ncbi:MAG: hypothetical protein A2898_02240 [Candidatus Kerfeldbacteria bacterium RIFCSPLOWO2_01_FULL_48_11]|uniref:Uncharacterized protein n=1 Tax=Candidatus Kerfeldbacteria bacterium RIFCSPLOWO2_01_FULL_48_11 TaxID=1798543 RepID=A0A1G2B1P8_9BACT|nr:MAG: Formamidopyrimidine-DNA glycosylase [Parcubacteria group bacterium GW2011_GWA2_48_9]KKW16379.1 MAG: Formamidopyrimidine-DNA glycosylase [Parcubacteria group bacterium GW2011_GWC2_49_9]OGY83078.1 MAG: hypothetical protein A2898_02240 [Candidatus Kerfeldbacteria bacterium RIFCSPLOWO2_01_FULL_48_11]